MKRFFMLVIFVSFNAIAEDQIYSDYNEEEYYQEFNDEQYIEQDQTPEIEYSNDHYAHDERILIHQSDFEASAEAM